MKISFIFPVFNEAPTIVQIVDALFALPLPGVEKEIIIVDDCSGDGTREILRTQLAHRVDKIIYHEKNQGKGGAVHTGIAAATGEYITVQDADMEYDPNDFVKLLKPIQEGRADVVYGSRYLFSQERRVLEFWHTMINKSLTAISNMLTNLQLTDVEVCYKIF